MQNITSYNKLCKSKTTCVIGMLLCLFVYPASLFALPADWSVEAGSANVESPDANTLNFTVADKTVINFGSFNIAMNEAVNFIQPSATSTVLNRVTGPSLSNIAGTLTANGILFLINPNGIHFAPTANIQVNALVASTLDITTQNFLENSFIFQHGSEHPYAQILNEGRITGNNIALLGSSVHNDGIIRAVAGTAHLASGDKITVSFDARQLIQVEINEETSGMVVDADGNTVQDALLNSGTIEASQVFLTAGVARNIFENAVNQTGIIKAITINEQDGVIRILSDKKVRLAGLLQATGGFVDITSKAFIEVTGEFQTAGTTTIEAYGDIQIRADFTNVSGDLFLIADSDLDGVGAFTQAEGTFVATVESGDITIQSSGEGTLANIDSSGDLILKQGGAAAVFTQQPGSTVVTKGSMVIESGVTVQGANTQYEVGKNWVNQGEFIPQQSTVSLVSPLPAFVLGNNTFNNFVIIEPGKIVKFGAEETQTILGILTVRGSYGNLVSLGSIEPPKQWQLNPKGSVDVMFAYLGDVINIRGPPIVARASDSSGNLTNWVVNVLWTGNGSSSNWSDANNWDTGTVPVSTSQVLFDGITGLNPNKDSVVDSAFQGTLDYLTLDGYIGTLCLEHSLTLTGGVTLKSGTLSAGSQTITVAGNWVNQGGTFLAGTSTVVFNDGSKPSYIYGDNTFYGFKSTTPDKEFYFEAGKTYTFKGVLDIIGAPDVGPEEYFIKLRSQETGSPWYLDLQTDIYNLDRVNISDSYALGVVIIPRGVDAGNNVNLEIDPEWDGGGADNNWSTANNWDGNAVPTGAEDVVFGKNIASSKDVDIDNLGAWSGGKIQIKALYTGTITLKLNVNLTVSKLEMQGGAGFAFVSEGGTSVLTVTEKLKNKGTGGAFSAPTTVHFLMLAKSEIQLQTGDSLTDLIIDKTAAGILQFKFKSNFTVSNDLTIRNNSGSGSIDFLSDSGAEVVTVGGDLLIGDDTPTAGINFGTSGLNAVNVNVAGDLSVVDSNVTVLANVTFNGAGTQNVTHSAGTISTGTWTVNGASAVVTQLSNLNLSNSGDLTITDGTFYTNGSNLTVDGTFTNNDTLRLQGNETVSTPTNNAGSTVTYVGTAGVDNLNIQNWTYRNLTINAGATDTFRPPSGISPTVNEDFTITSGIFNTNDGAADRNVTVSGDLDIEGTLTANSSTVNLSGNLSVGASGSVTQGTGTWIFDGTSAGKTITAGGVNGAFPNVQFTGSGGEWTLQDDMYVAGQFKVTDGKFISGANTVTLQGASATYQNSDINATNTTWTGGTLNIQSNVDQTLPSNEVYNNLQFGRNNDVSGTTIYDILDSGATINGTWTIDANAKVKLTFSATGVNKVYDGSTTATATFSDNHFAGFFETFSYNYTATFNNKNVGVGKPVSVTGVSLSGADAGKYSLASTTDSTTANITARALTITGAANTKTYDAATSAATLPTITSGALQGSDTANFIETYDNKNVGTSKVMTPSGNVTDGNSGNNYTYTFVTSSNGTITARAITVTADAGQTKVYGAADPVFTYTNTPLVGGDSFSGVLSRVAGETVAGSPYAITQGTLSAGSNYTITFVADTFSITAKSLTVGGSFTASNKVYDGNTSATILVDSLTPTGVLGGDTVTLNPVAAFSDATVGIGKTVSLTTSSSLGSADAGNYSLSLVGAPTTTADITPVPPPPSPSEPSANASEVPSGEEPIYRPPEFHPPTMSGPPVMPVMPILTPTGPVIMPVVQVLPGGNLLLVNPKTRADFGEIVGGAQFSNALTREDFGAVTGAAQFPKALTRVDFGAVTGKAELPKPLTRADFGEVVGEAFMPSLIIFERVTGGVFFSSED